MSEINICCLFVMLSIISIGITCANWKLQKIIDLLEGREE